MLPEFKFHPDPLNTGAIKPNDDACACCEESRGYAYTGSIYCRSRAATICPWCIADGSAAEKFRATFVAGRTDCSPVVHTSNLTSRLRRLLARAKYWLRKHAIARKQVAAYEAVDKELFTRTPGFASFQEQDWQVHCNEPCEFHGMASTADLRKMTSAAKARLFSNSSLDETEFQQLVQDEASVELDYYLKFVCRKCQEILVTEDLD